MKEYTYHKYHSYKTSEGKPITLRTQQYQIGIYAILNDDPALQFSTTPKSMVRTEKKLKESLEKGEITDLVFSGELTVTESEEGLWVGV